MVLRVSAGAVPVLAAAGALEAGVDTGAFFGSTPHPGTANVSTALRASIRLDLGEIV
ncbi:hypothetical protein [Micromonospora sp. NPDC005173]|uniref:hypothetical protein n=1 Tax=Micromonospora sp. NPDC005173 TaxID=3157165 RepID=UPI0033ACC298